jgi:undecaprenyl diphosphate synthase
MDKNPPKHIAIICDGNRSWARARGLKVFMGHEKAVNEVFENLIDHGTKLGIEYLTFWIFSTENWKRDKVEVDFLMNLFRKIFDEKIDKWFEKGVCVRMIGDINGFEKDIQERIKDGVAKTSTLEGVDRKITVTLAMNYGGRDELKRTMQKLAKKAVDGELKPEEITEKMIAENLDTNYMPDPEMIVRTGEDNTRLSGFMSWQQQYSEIIFPGFNFPEFTPEKLDEVLEEFYSRNRRFGG